MSWNKKDFKEYNNEVKFQVGQMVEVDIPTIPIEDRDQTKGLIIAINTKFPLSKELREIIYTVRLIGNYAKKKFFQHIKGDTTVKQKQLKLLK